MATQTLYLTGKFNWAHHLFTPDEYNGVQKYKCDFYPDKESLAKFKASGSKWQLKLNDETSEIFFRPSCPTHKQFAKGLQEFKVDVLDAEGNPWPEGVAIGNGSEGVIKVEVYDTSYGTKGSRLKAVRIDKLVEYVKPEGSVSSAVQDAPFPF